VEEGEERVDGVERRAARARGEAEVRGGDEAVEVVEVEGGGLALDAPELVEGGGDGGLVPEAPDLLGGLGQPRAGIVGACGAGEDEALGADLALDEARGEGKGGAGIGEAFVLGPAEQDVSRDWAGEA